MFFADDVTTMFDPHSPQAKSVFDLFSVSAVILAVIMVIVAGLVGYIVQRFGARPGESGEPPQVHGNTPMEVTWTLIPLGIVTLLTFLMARTMLDTHGEPAANQAPDVTVIGHQWWWEVKYPSGLVTANEVHLPVGKKSLVALESADVIHDFWVPQLGPKQDMLPDQHNYIYLEPSTAGVYRGACAEFCGNEHAWMRILVKADPPEVFEAWQKAEMAAFEAPGRPSATPAGADTDAQQGARVFAEKTCMNCHRGPDMATGPNFGPDLTWVGDRLTLGAGAVPDNSPIALGNWLRNPQTFKAECNMPDFHLTEDEVRTLVAYLWRKSQ